MTGFTIRTARPGEQAAAYDVCLKTGNHGRNGEPFYRDDPDALGRIFAGPYLAFEPAFALVLVCDTIQPMTAHGPRREAGAARSGGLVAHSLSVASLFFAASCRSSACRR